MHFFSVSNRKYCFDDRNCRCFRLDDASEAALRIWNDSGRSLSSSEVVEELAGKGFSQEVADEVKLDLEQYFELDECQLIEPKVTHCLRSVELHVSHACNLGCSYCFAGKGDYGTSPMLMEEGVAFKAIDYLVSQSNPEEALTIVFFGGEPLLNKPLIWKTVDYIATHHPNRKFSYSITTNGTLLDEQTVEEFKTHGFSVLVSMDGTGSKHDQSRPYKNGKGSFDDIKEGVERFSEVLPFGVRATLTKGNCDLISDMETFREMGFRRVYFSPVSTFDTSLAIDKPSMDGLRKQLELLSEEYYEAFRADGKRSGTKPVFRGLEQFLIVVKNRCLSKVGCGAGRRFVSVTPDGDYYPCHRFVGMTHYKMGSVFDGIDQQLYSENWKDYVSKRDDCSSCWIQNICGGGCSWEAAGPDGMTKECLYPPSCDYRRMCYEIAFDLLNRIEEPTNEDCSPTLS